MLRKRFLRALIRSLLSDVPNAKIEFQLLDLLLVRNLQLVESQRHGVIGDPWKIIYETTIPQFGSTREWCEVNLFERVSSGSTCDFLEEVLVCCARVEGDKERFIAEV